MTDETPLEQHGLERIVLLDSYLGRSRIEMRLSGHTAITGANSAGKTTFIRLLPLFFGAEPGRIVNTRSGALQGFNTYYLPRDGSYVVFEYRTAEGLQLAVFITTGDFDRTKAVLLSGGYQDALFLSEQDTFLLKDELVERARSTGRSTLVCTSLRDYRRIVLGPPRGLNAAARRYNILAGYPDAHRLSLESAHDIILATIGNDVDEKLLRRLMFEQAAVATGIDTQEMTLGLNYLELDEWNGNYIGLKKLRERHADARLLLAQAEEMRACGYSEAVVREAAAQRLAADKQALAAAEDEQQDAEAARQALQEEYQKREVPYRQTKQQLADQQTDLTANRDYYARQEETLRDEGLEEALCLSDEFNLRQDRLTGVQKRLSILRSESKAIDTEVDQAKRQTQLEYEQRVQPLEREQSELATAQTEANQTLNASQAKKWDAFDRTWDAKEEALTGQRQCLADAEAEARIALATANAEPHSLEALTQRQRDLEAAQAAQAAAKEQFKAADQSLSEAITRGETLTQQAATLQTNEQRLTERENHLTEQLKRTGTLLEFYRNEVPAAVEPLSAVLIKGVDLLFTDDLNPSPAESADSSLFGVQIDTSRLPSVDVDRELHDELDQVRQARAKARTELQQVKRDLEALTGEQQQYGKERSAAEDRLTFAAHRHQSAENALRAAQQAAEASRGQQQAQAARLHTTAKVALEQAKTEIATFRTNRISARQSLRAEQQAAQEKLAADFTTRHKSLQEQFQQHRAQLEQNLEQLEEARRQRLADGGISPDALVELEAEEQAARVALAEARDALALVDRWQDFTRERDKKLPTLLEDIAALEQTIREYEAEWRAYEQQYLQGLQDQKEREEQARQREQELNSAIQLLESRLDTELIGWNGALDVDTVAAKARLAASELEAELREAQQAARLHMEGLHRKLMEFQPLFYQSPSSRCLEFAEDQGLAGLIDRHNAAALQRAAEVLRVFYGDPALWQTPFTAFPAESAGGSFEDALRVRAASIIELRGFVSRLEAMHRQVQEQNRRIRVHYAAMLRHLPTIDRIEVDARMQLEQIDGYSAARRSFDALERYERERLEQNNPRLLPGSEVVAALRELADYLRHRSDRQKVNMVDALSLEFTVHHTDKVVQARNGARLKDAFSNGIGILVAEVVLVGFLESMRQGLPITIPWMLDELLTLDETNITGLLEGLAALSIYLVSTSPDIRNEYDSLFARRYTLMTLREDGSRRTIPMMMEIPADGPTIDPFDAIDAELDAQLETTEVADD